MNIDYKYGSEIPREDGQPSVQPGINDNPFVRPIDQGMGGFGGQIGGGGGGGGGFNKPSGDDFDFGMLPPPIPEGGDRDITRPDPDDDNRVIEEPKPVTNEIAKNALIEMASANFCYGKSPANEAVINNLRPSSAYHYCLQSFTETRFTAMTEVPFTGGGQSVDSAANGPPPSPWDVPVQPKAAFTAEKRVLEVPHTASVQPCKKCSQTGFEKCAHCNANGQVPCSQCNGQSGSECLACGGQGAKVCGACAGKGQSQCSLCKGAKMVKSFVQLTVEWHNHQSDFVVQKELSLPENLVKQAQGTVVFKEQNPWVYPISQCPEPAINKASMELLTKHKNEFKNERLIFQRQTVEIVPVTEVECQWKDQMFKEYVYGIDQRAYCAEYPQKWCCGMCSVM